MSDRIQQGTDTPPSLTTLVGGIVDDLQRLIRQEIELARREVHQEWEKTKVAAGAMAAGASLAALAAVLLCFFFVHLLAWATPLPLWAWFGIVGGVLLGGAAILLLLGRQKASQINVVPPQTAQTMRENVQWIKNQT